LDWRVNHRNPRQGITTSANVFAVKGDIRDV